MAEFNKTLPSVEDVAKAFVAQLQKDISADEFAQVVALQKSNPIEGVCHSHDFCDANMTMDAALESLGVQALPDTDEGMSDEVSALWNASWDKAKEMLETL